MQIYSKKQFASGIFMVALGAANLIADIAAQNVEFKGIILIVALFLFGCNAIFRSLSKKHFLEEKLEELDERNQLIELKSKSKSFQLTNGISFTLMIAVLVAAKRTGYDGYIGIALGLAFSCAVSMFAEIFTYLYYEQHN